MRVKHSIATKPHTSRLESETEEEPAEPKKKRTRRTRKTRSSEPEPEAIDEEDDGESARREVDSEVNDEGDFSDFSL